jgi:hypothetical protein
MDMIGKGFVKINSKCVNNFKTKINMKVCNEGVLYWGICWAFFMVSVLANRVDLIFLPEEENTARFRNIVLINQITKRLRMSNMCAKLRIFYFRELLWV